MIFFHSIAIIPKFLIGIRYLNRLITLDSKTQYNLNIQKITNKAAQMLGFIIRNTQHCQNQCYEAAVLYIVRSHLGFASVVCFPIYEVRNEIETFQNKFLKYLSFVRFYTYAPRT